MTKSENLAREIIQYLEAYKYINHLKSPVDGVAFLIKSRFKQVHDEAVDATVIAENSKTFVRPDFED